MGSIRGTTAAPKGAPRSCHDPSTGSGWADLPQRYRGGSCPCACQESPEGWRQRWAILERSKLVTAMYNNPNKYIESFDLSQVIYIAGNDLGIRAFKATILGIHMDSHPPVLLRSHPAIPIHASGFEFDMNVAGRPCGHLEHRHFLERGTAGCGKGTTSHRIPTPCPVNIPLLWGKIYNFYGEKTVIIYKYTEFRWPVKNWSWKTRPAKPWVHLKSLEVENDPFREEWSSYWTWGNSTSMDPMPVSTHIF